MNAIYILLAARTQALLALTVQIFVSLAQPAFFLLAFGFGFGPVFEKAGQGSYLQFMAPASSGRVWSSVLSSPALPCSGTGNRIPEGNLVAPVPRLYIMIAHARWENRGHDSGVLILPGMHHPGLPATALDCRLSAFGFVAMIALSSPPLA